MSKQSLEALKKAWSKAKADAEEFSNPHFNDGHYLTKISEVKVGESKKGLPQLVIDFSFMEGEYAGKSKRTWWNLDPSNAQGLAITIGTLMRLGLTDVEPETLEEDIKHLLGKIVRIQIVTTTAKDGVTEYQNVRIEKVMGVDPETADAPKAVDEVAPEAEAEEESEEATEEPAEEEEQPTTKKKSKKEEESEEVEEEVEEESDEEDGVDIEVGMKVSFTKKDGSELIGTIEDIDEENGKVVVKSKVDGVFKKFRVDVDRLSAL